MSKKRYPLTPTQPTQAVGLEFEAGIMLVFNPTASPVLVRVGAPEIPTSANADYIIPANGVATLSVVGKEFGITFLDTTLIASLSAGNLGTRALIQFQTPDEPIPQFGAANFLSLSVSDLTIGLPTYAGPTGSSIFNITPWGGALVFVNPNSGSGQAVCVIVGSNDGISFTQIGMYSIWPGVPTLITVPRVMRFLQVQFNSIAFAGEPAISGSYTVRATLAEVQKLTYNPSGNSIVKGFAMGAGGSQQFQFIAVGLPAISLAAIATSGTGGSAAATLLVEASSDNINWRQVTFRTQRMTTGVTLARFLGPLDIFLRISIFEVSGISALQGILYLNIPSEPDENSILNTIQQSLGDSSAPSNTNQSIYHELDTIRQALGSGNLTTILNSINSMDTTYLPNISAQSNSIAAGTSHLPNIDTNIAAIEVADVTYLPNISAQSNSIANGTAHLPTIETYASNLATYLPNISSQSNNTANGTSHLPAIDSNIASINTFSSNISAQANSTANGTSHLPAMDTNLASLVAAHSAPNAIVCGAAGMGGAGVWTNMGSVFATGWFITAAQFGMAITAGGVGGARIIAALGNAGGPGTNIFHNYAAAGFASPCNVNWPTMNYGSSRTVGRLVASTENFLWLWTDTTGTVSWTFAIS